MEVTYYNSPVGELKLVFMDGQLISLTIMEGGTQSEQVSKISKNAIKVHTLLDRYFKGEPVDFKEIDYLFEGTSFQKCVWEEVMSIPYGEVMSYKDITLKVAKRLNKPFMSCQAVGSAIGKNKIAIIIPCHRVVGSHGKLGGYRYGVSKKMKLLEIEKVSF